MELFQIRYVLAAAETLNFTRAAERCNVSQPALTKAVKAIEQELGTQLFHRDGKRVSLSDFGRSILPTLRQMNAEAERVRSIARDFRFLHQVPVRLGVLATVGSVRFARYLAAFQQAFEGVEVEVSEGTVNELLNRLDEGGIDLAIVNPADGVPASFRCRDLYTENYVAVLPPNHRWADRDIIRLRDLSGEPCVDRRSCEMREMFLKVCGEQGIEIYARFRSEREDWVQAMVLAGIGVAVMPEFSVSVPELLQRPIVEPAISRTIALVSVPGRPFSPATAAMVRSAQSFDWPV